MDAAGGSEVAGSRDGLVLLGFKSRAALKDYHNMRTSYFVYPNEKVGTGGGDAAPPPHLSPPHDTKHPNAPKVQLSCVCLRAPSRP